ncbi:sulfurtransferase TusA family protein [Aliikangiella maris]|uniref:Sulfurtransferase TusA family protein n=2 Tax=Aliikangiella maris TaxID=3162458 RepID=A0ABV3MS45_9GAMM
MNTEQTLDLKGFTCPIPLLRTKKVLKQMAAGDVLKILITDPNTKGDLNRFCQRGNYEMIDEISQGDHDVFIIRKCDKE